MSEHQPPLFDDPRQPRRKRREPVRYYDAVLLLRKSGFTVVRAGRSMALVNGKLFTASTVIRMAMSVSQLHTDKTTDDNRQSAP